MQAVQKIWIEHMVYPAMELMKGNHIRSALRSLSESSCSNASSVQRERLTNLLIHCVNHVPAYQALQPNEQAIHKDPYAVLSQSFPPLRKRTFQLNAEKYLADNIPPQSRIANCTGGSTGEPIHFFMTRPQVESYEAARWRGMSWYGITPGSRSVMLWGSPIELSKQKQSRQRFLDAMLKNRTILSAYDLTEKTVSGHVEFINRYRPEYLYGYSTILSAFAQMVKKQGLGLNFKLKAIVSTSETLHDWQRELLKDTFGCPVANEYGARDAGILAYSCPQEKLHITAENCVIEVLDPLTLEPLPVGERGILAITDLGNFVQPRLRYLIGDYGALSGETCSCGCGLPLMAAIEGREDALLVGKNGALVHGNVIGQFLRPMPELLSYQFRQHSPQAATLYLVKAPSKTVDEKKVLELMHLTFPDTTVQLEYVDSIPPAKSGKMRYAIREFEINPAPGR